MNQSPGKNIVIFSDGTGQVGGIYFDEDRTNIYKLYRATRVGPDTEIDPRDQVAFYDPGLGSARDGNGLWTGLSRKIYNVVSQATGFGITANMIDCYAALIRLWKPGDRIFLFGFSRGSYTVRCLGGVIGFCGIPTHDPQGNRLKLDIASSRKVASYAVKHVYQFTTSRRPEYATDDQKFLLETRRLIAQRFRRDYRSAHPTDPALANCYPYFIGVFDTVAALGSLIKTLLLGVFFGVIAACSALLMSTIPTSAIARIPLADRLIPYWSWGWIFAALLVMLLAYSISVYFFTHLKWDFRVPGYSWRQKLATIHFTELWQEFYDFNLNEEVRYAKHAISIDESRKDFKRVKWGQRNIKYTPRDEMGNMRFEQIWFSGNHADVGGGYPEIESRLSDISLKWMLACATTIPSPLKFDRSLLHLYPDPAGMQHDEIKVGFGIWTKLLGINWAYARRVLAPEDKPPPKSTILHRSVYDRFNLGKSILHYDEEQLYRPQTLSEHVDFESAYKQKGASPAQCTCVAHEVEISFDRLPQAKI